MAPFALNIHPRKQEGPANPGNHDEYQKRMPMQKIEPRGTLFSFDWPALGRSNLIQKFRSQDDDNRAAPIGNGVPEKCAQVSFRIEQAVIDYPDNQQPDRDETQEWR